MSRDTVVLLTKRRRPGADSWYPWTGGECPVALDAYVEYKMRNFARRRNTHAGPNKASELRWHWVDTDGDIVAYRIAK